MRTTVPPDSDAEQLLKDEPPFAVQARSMGLRSGIDAARPNQVSDELEAERFGELGRRRCHFPLDE